MNLKIAMLTMISLLSAALMYPQDVATDDSQSSAAIQSISVSDTTNLDSLPFIPIDSIPEIDLVKRFIHTLKPKYASLTDSLLRRGYAPDTVMSFKPLPRKFFLPVVFNTYFFPDTTSVFTPDYSGNPALKWAEDDAALTKRMRAITQMMILDNPSNAPFNVVFLPELPKEYVAEVNPEDHTIAIREFALSPAGQSTIAKAEIKKRHWMRTFNASLQFSQAFVSPNWYQGGNNNVNALLDVYYNVKLNQQYHPNILFENTFQYKLGMNSAPDDTLRSYNVSTDIFQINSVFGLKASKKWYYSVTGQFKTQLVNSFASNTNNLRSAFMSPAELTVGIGMTYNTAAPDKKWTLDASIAPLSYNLNICTSNRMDPGKFNIDPGKHAKSTFGSSYDVKFIWKIAYNITLNSRLFVFTNYDRLYSDWENTIVFEINKYLTSQFYTHLRYDTDTPRVADSDWRKLQLKEILSLGFAYKFSTI